MHRAAVGHHGCGSPVQVWGLPRSVGPAGLVTAAPGDLLAFARLHLDGGVTADGKRLLSEAAVAAMQSPHIAIPDLSAAGSAIGLGWRMSRWGGRTVIGHDGDTVGQSAYLRIDPEAGVAACLLTNSAQSETLYQALFGEIFGELTGATIPAPLRPAAGAPNLAAEVDLGQHAGRYERTSRRFDVSVRHGQLRIVLTMTGNLAALTGSEPEELVLHPADPFDSSGTRFVLRSGDDEPWVPLIFGRLGDGTPYIHLSGRVTPRVS